MLAFFRKLGAALFGNQPQATDPTRCFTPREWADMPVHHPLCDAG